MFNKINFYQNPAPISTPYYSELITANLITLGVQIGVGDKKLIEDVPPTFQSYLVTVMLSDEDTGIL